VQNIVVIDAFLHSFLQCASGTLFPHSVQTLVANNGGRDFFGQALSSSISRGAAQGGGSAPAVLISNGDFENGLASWNVLGGTLVSGDAQSGSNAFQTNPSFGGLTQVISGLAPNTDYTLTGWAKVGTAGEPVYFGVKNYGDAEKNGNVTATSYTQIGISFRTGSSNTSAEIYCYRNEGTTPAVCDNFVLNQGNPTPPTVNFVSNSDFENGTASWNASGGSVITSGAQSGASAFQTDTSFSGVQQVISGLTPNTDYVLTGWAKVGTAGEAVYIGVKDFGGAETNGTVTSTDYVQVSLTFRTGSSNTSAQIYCWRNDGTTPAICDNFVLRQGN